MKLTVLGLTLAALFIGGTQLEARSHFSFNIGPVFAPPAYVVQPYPAYVQQRTYVDSWGYPYHREAVVVQPAPAYYPVAPQPFYSFGFGWRVR